MIEEQQPEEVNDAGAEENEPAVERPEPERMTQAVRREKLVELQARIGEHAQLDGDVVVIEAGEPVVLHIELDRDGSYTLTWWVTALTDHGHHRWRDAAASLLRENEAIYTSALGGGYLIEIERTSRDEAEVVGLANDSARVERVRELLTAFPDAVAALPEEPVPDYLLPPEPEVPVLGDAEGEATAEYDDPEEFTADS